jgi:hypothetical protein
MFRKPTVIILGAGANVEFGLPLGNGLMSAVETNLRVDGRGIAKTESADEFLRLLKNRFGPEEYRDYLNAGKELVQVMGRFRSLDEALHYLSADTKCIVAGKAAIVSSILGSEKNSKLKIDGRLGRPDLPRVVSTWAPHFLSMAVSDLTMGEISRIFENVTIINFNYDRSLEHYLYWALQGDLGVPRNEAGDIVKGMKVLRPYGSVGPLDWQAEGGVPYGGPDNLDVSLFQMADGIRTYTEQCHTELRAQIDAALNSALLIVILGFGFHSQNLELFKAPSPGRRMDNRRVFATVKGFVPENHGVLSERLTQHLRTSVPMQLLDRTACEMLRDLQLAIMAATN